MPKKTPTKSKAVSSAAPKRRSKGDSAKLDLYAKHKNEYVANEKTPGLVRVGPARYLSVEGRSQPASVEFNRAVGALYSVAFTIKMARKFAGHDYAVSKLEGLWSTDEPLTGPPDASTIWNWELLIRVPTFITAKEVQSTVEELVQKGKGEDLRGVRLVSLDEGECVQMLHIGPYTAEQPTLNRMREFAELAGRSFAGRHHEIYLSDPRRVPAERLKTILRQPVE
jgi:hypothetical protein